MNGLGNVHIDLTGRNSFLIDIHVLGLVLVQATGADLGKWNVVDHKGSHGHFLAQDLEILLKVEIAKQDFIVLEELAHLYLKVMQIITVHVQLVNTVLLELLRLHRVLPAVIEIQQVQQT